MSSYTLLLGLPPPPDDARCVSVPHVQLQADERCEVLHLHLQDTFTCNISPYTVNLCFLLLRSGDVEKNPGPGSVNGDNMDDTIISSSQEIELIRRTSLKSDGT